MTKKMSTIAELDQPEVTLGEEVESQEKPLGKEEVVLGDDAAALPGFGRWVASSHGLVTFLRVNDVGHVYGSGNDTIRTEVVFGNSALPGHAFGFNLKTGDRDLPANLAMLSTIRDAKIHKIPIKVWFWQLRHGVSWGKNSVARRVQLK